MNKPAEAVDTMAAVCARVNYKSELRKYPMEEKYFEMLKMLDDMRDLTEHDPAELIFYKAYKELWKLALKGEPYPWG